MGSSRIQCNVHIEQRERSKKKFAFVQCKWTLNVSASKSVNSVLTPHKLENDFDKEIINVSAGFSEAKTFMLYACIILQAVFFSIVYGLLPILGSQYIYHFDFKILHWHLFRCCKRIISMLQKKACILMKITINRSGISSFGRQKRNKTKESRIRHAYFLKFKRRSRVSFLCLRSLHF